MSSRSVEKRHERILRDLLKKPENKKCFNCEAMVNL